MWQIPDDGTFFSLETRVVKHMRVQQHVNDRVLDLMTEACENALKADNVVLSQAERAILRKNAMKELLNELLSDQK